MSTKGMNRLQKFDIEDVLQNLEKRQNKFWIPNNNKSIHIKHLFTERMLLIARTRICEACLLEGTYFWLEQSGTWSPHFNLYGPNRYGHECLLTMDHIIPKSKGGTTTQDNIQLLCEKCNRIKKNLMIGIDGILRRRLQGDPLMIDYLREAYEKHRPEFLPNLEFIFDHRKNPFVCQEIS